MIFHQQYSCQQPHFQDPSMNIRKANRPEDPYTYLLIQPRVQFVPVFQPIIQKPQGILIPQPVLFNFSSLHQLDFMALCDLLFQQQECEFIAPDIMSQQIVSFNQRGYIRNSTRWDILKQIRVNWSKQNESLGRDIQKLIYTVWTGKAKQIDQLIVNAMRGILKVNRVKLTKDVSIERFLILSKRKQQGSNQDLYFSYYCDPIMPRPAIIKLIGTGKGDTQPKRIDQYFRKIRLLQAGQIQGTSKIIKCQVKQNKIIIVMQYMNGGSLSFQLNNHKAKGIPFSWDFMVKPLQRFVKNMIKITQLIGGHSCLLPRFLYLNNQQILLGEPMFISERIQKKMHQSRYDPDFFAPQLKNSIFDYSKFMALSQQKMDIWSYGMLLFHMFNLGNPTFNESNQPIFTRNNLSPQLKGLIIACLSKEPQHRPGWRDINMQNLAKFRIRRELDISSIRQAGFGDAMLVEDSHQSSPTKLKEVQSKQYPLYQQRIQGDELQRYNRQQFKQVLKSIRMFKTILRTILQILFLILVFFLPFIINGTDLLSRRGFLRKFHIINTDQSFNYQSGTTILTDNTQYFAFNQLSFQQVTALQCIRDQFNPNDNFSFFDFIRSGSFFWWTISGFIIIIVILALRGIMACRSNFWVLWQDKVKWKVWAAWIFNQLAFCMLLFGHFYIFSFQYFTGTNPCLKVDNIGGVQPFFDSALYLILGNVTKFMSNIFSVVGIMTLVMAISNIIFAIKPNQQQKNFLNPILFLIRILGYFAFLLLGRIGLFLLISPSILNDPAEIIINSLTHSFAGFIGFIPQIIGILLFLISSLLQLCFHFVQAKAIQSDKFRSFFSIKKKHRIADSSIQQLNDESRQESRQAPVISMIVQ